MQTSYIWFVYVLGYLAMDKEQACGYLWMAWFDSLESNLTSLVKQNLYFSAMQKSEALSWW